MTRAERRRALHEGQEVSVSELTDVNPQPKKPYRALMFGWNRHGAVKMYPVELNAENQIFRQKVADAFDLMRRMVGVGDPSPYELGYFHGMHGGPLSRWTSRWR